MNLKVNLAGIKMKNPVTVASGTFGYGREYSEFIDLNKLGGIIHMICARCGQENQQDAVFCKKCGRRLDGNSICPTCGPLPCVKTILFPSLTRLTIISETFSKRDNCSLLTMEAA